MKLPGWPKKPEVDKWDEKVGMRMRKAREYAKLSQAEVAKLMFKSQGNLSDYEAGRHRISAIDLGLFAYAVDTPVEDLIPAPRFEPKQMNQLRPKERTLIHYVRKIGDDARENKVLDLLFEQAKHYVEAIIDGDIKADMPS